MDIETKTVNELDVNNLITNNSDLLQHLTGNDKNKKYKKLMKNVQKDPKLQELLNYFKQKQTVNQKEVMTNSDRLRAKIEQKRMVRVGRTSQQTQFEKKLERTKKKNQSEKKTEKQKEEELQNNVQSKLVHSIEQIKTQNKSKRDRLRKLQKKYGQLTFDRYCEALKLLGDELLNNEEDINREKNIVDLYLKQNPNETEKHLDVGIIDADFLEDNEDDTDEMEDLSHTFF